MILFTNGELDVITKESIIQKRGAVCFTLSKIKVEAVNEPKNNQL
jgi:hypothetical protein